MSINTVLSEQYFSNMHSLKLIILAAAIIILNGCGDQETYSNSDTELYVATVTLSWDANPATDAVTQYEIFAGSTLEEAANNSEMIVNVTQEGFNAEMPSVTYSIDQLGFMPGETACFRLKAHNIIGVSNLSDGVCENIPK